MASTSLDPTPMADLHSIHQKKGSETLSLNKTPIAYGIGDEVGALPSYSNHSNTSLLDNTHRKLKPRHIQLIGIGGYAKEEYK